MPVLVMHIGCVRVRVLQTFVYMQVCVWLASWIIRLVTVLMAFIMDVRV